MMRKLVHYFNPDFNHLHLLPHEEKDGRVDHYNLGYAQNVIAGQVVAELVPLDKELPQGAEGQFIREAAHLPIGPNTIPNPDNPDQLIASVNGYVFYHNGVITVKRMLNVRRDVDFHTGNIVFIGDICVHGSVRTGFEVHGKNILVKGTVQGARITAREDITFNNGVKGGKTAFIKAGGDIRLPFIENAELLAKGDILVDGSSMHTSIWVGGKLAVKGRLQGGSIYANRLVYVGEQLGGGIGTITSIILGYDPFSMRKISKLEEKIAKLDKRVDQMRVVTAKSAVHMQEYGGKLQALKKKLAALIRQRKAILTTMENHSAKTNPRVIVPGELKPGVEISIGGAYCMIQDFMNDVCIFRRDDEIVIESPAIQKK